MRSEPASRRPRRARRDDRRAFTLLEVIVVVTIIALLATLVAPRLLSQVGKAKKSTAQAKASTVAEAVNLYLLDMGLSAPGDNFDLQFRSVGMMQHPVHIGFGGNRRFTDGSHDITGHQSGLGRPFADPVE